MRSVFSFLAFVSVAGAAPLLDYPTANRAITSGESEEFYQYVDRYFGGEKSQPWQGGQFGYVRTPRVIDGNVVYTRMHEGIDIKPLNRDADGHPTDPILASAAGTVAYVNDSPGGSNYGRYVVVTHRAAGSDYYTLYAHLASVAVEAGDAVEQGQTLGIMGYSGRGLDRTRAHVHFEFALMMSEHFNGWHAEVYRPGINPHGNFNGQNLAGINPAELLVAAAAEPDTFSLEDFLRSQPIHYKIAIPASPSFTLHERYPWMLEGDDSDARAWEVGFTQYGAPVRVAAMDETLTEPRVTFVKPTEIPIIRATNGVVGGTAGHPELTNSGKRKAALLTQGPSDPE